MSENLQASDTPLVVASRHGRMDEAAALIESGADVNEPTTDVIGASPLIVACFGGHIQTASLLIEKGAAVNQATIHGGMTPLFAACGHQHFAIVSLLLSSGADVNLAEDMGATPLTVACTRGNLACVQLISSHGAGRTFPRGSTAERIAGRCNHEEVFNWLVATRLWSTPLHHLTIIDATRARELLRGGADLHAAAAADGPTPLSLARELHTAGNAAEGTAAHLVLRAAGRWSEQTHELFPAVVRARAAELMLLGHRFSRQEGFLNKEVAIFDAWMHHVMPFAIERDLSPESPLMADLEAA